jgi:hypothetical protein
MNSEIMDALNNNLLTCEPVDDNDQSMVNENTATYLVDGSKDILNTQSALGIAFIIILVAIVSSYLGAPLFYKYAISNFITKGTSLSLLTGFVGFMLFLLGIILLLGGNKYDSTEMLVGVFMIIFLLLSSLAIALDRFSKKQEPAMADFDDTMNNALDTIKDLIANFWYKKGEPGVFDKKYVGIFSGIYLLVLIILSIATGTLDSYKDVVAKEKKTKGYIEHLQSLIFSIGAIYGLIFLIWIIMAFKYSE